MSATTSTSLDHGHRAALRAAELWGNADTPASVVKKSVTEAMAHLRAALANLEVHTAD